MQKLDPLLKHHIFFFYENRNLLMGFEKQSWAIT